MQSQQVNPEGAPIQHDYLALIIRRRWWIVSSAVATWALALLAAWLLPPKYRSETLILVEQPKVSTQYVTPNLTADLQSRLQSLTDQILSRTRLLRIVDELHLYGSSGNDPDQKVQKMRDDTKVDLVAQTGDRDVSGFKISFSASDPAIAQQVAGRLSSLFIEENLRNQQQLSEGTTQFLESELAGARKDLETQEAQLRDFRSRHLGELPEQLQGNMQILGGLQARLDSAGQALNHAEQQRLYLVSLLEQYKTSRRGEGGMKPLSIQQRIDQLKAQYADAQTRYTPRHPDVIRLKDQLDAAEKLQARVERTTQPASRDAAGTATDPPDAPAMQLSSQLKATELEIASKKKELTEVQRQIGQYQSRLTVTPARDQELAGLMRNYSQSRTNYESLLAKKLQSQMATNLEKRQEGEQFRILDPPSYPERPYFPQRLRFALGGLVAGILLGTALSIGLELLNPRVYREQDITALGQMVIGTVPPLPTVTELQTAARQRRMEWVFATLALVTIPVVTLVTYLKS